MLQTPGTWLNIPKGATIVASRKGAELRGKMLAVAGEGPDRVLTFERDWDNATESLYARHGWEVQYEVDSFADIVKRARIGTEWRNSSNDVRFVKISEEYVTQQVDSEGGQWTYPEVLAIESRLNFGGARYREIKR